LEASREAWVHLLRGEHEIACEKAREGLRGADPARASVCLVESLHRLGRGEEAIESIKDYDSDHPGTQVGGFAIGRLERLRRNLDGAEEAFRGALRAAIVRNDSLARLVAIEQLANVLQDGGRFAEAADLHVESLELAGTAGDSLLLISSSYGLGYCLIAGGRYDESEALARTALEGARRFDLPLWVGDAEALVAVLHWIRLDLDGTFEHYDRAARAYERAGDASRQASCLRKMAATNRSRGEYPDAIETLHRARSLALGAGNAGEAAFALEHLGSLSHDLGNFDRARTQWEGALREGRDAWPPEWKSAALLNIGSLLVVREDHEAALRYLEEALEVLKESESRLAVPGALSTLAHCLRALGRVEEAVSKLLEAASLAREYDLVLSEADAFVELGHCYVDLDRLDEAERSFGKAADMTAGRGFYDFDSKVRLGQSLVARRQGKLEASLRYLEDALEIAESVRSRSREASAVQAGVFGEKRNLYEAAVDLLYAMHRAQPERGHDRAAFHVAQRAKARSFLDLLTEAKVRLRVRADTTYQRREQDILARIATLAQDADGDPRSATEAGEEIARLEDDLAILEREVRTADPQYAEIRYPSPPTLKEVQAEGLRPGELLLEYLVGDEASYVWAVTRDSCRLVQLPPRKAIQRSVRELLPLLGDYNLLGSDPAYLLAPVRDLSDALLRPVIGEVGGHVSILIAPDDVLHFLPFEALLRGDAPSAPRDYASLPFLVKTADVSYVASGGMLLGNGTATPGPSGRDMLLIGDPLLGKEGDAGAFFETATGRRLFRLADVQEEMQALREILGAGKVLELQGELATRRELRRAGALGHYRFVHFASHGVYNERRPRFSGIVLSADADEGDDGFLTIDEVFSLDIPCDQVVLSACFSAMGEHVRGEGIVGLTRGLLYAGARRVVAGLWAVSGWATARFMSKFYEESAREPSAAGSHALAEAKRWMIGQPSWSRDGGPAVDPGHPYFWAPFVAFGRESKGSGDGHAAETRD
jgi:CHAT domain-containing protein